MTEQNMSLKKMRQSYAKKKKQHKQKYQEKKEKIKEKNKKASKDFLLYIKKKNEEEIDQLPDKGKDLNFLYRSSNNLKEILAESTVFCENCKDAFDPNAILKHIGNNNECKTFYGQSFERFKVEKEKLRIKKSILAKQRKDYAADLKIRECKKESNTKTYQTFKKKQSLVKEKEKIEFEKKSARQTFEFKKKIAIESNSLWRKKLQWIIDCFQHFLETFPQANDKVRNEMLDLVKSIQEKNTKMEHEIDEIIQKVETSEDYFEICSAFKGQKQENGLYKDGKYEEDIR